MSSDAASGAGTSPHTFSPVCGRSDGAPAGAAKPCVPAAAPPPRPRREPTTGGASDNWRYVGGAPTRRRRARRSTPTSVATTLQSRPARRLRSLGAGGWRGRPHREGQPCKRCAGSARLCVTPIIGEAPPPRRRGPTPPVGPPPSPLTSKSDGQSHRPSAAGTLTKPATWRATRSPSSPPAGRVTRHAPRQPRRAAWAAGPTAATTRAPRGRRDSRPPGARPSRSSLQ